MNHGLPWVILTGEFPPASGGVGDYTAQLAASLAAAGDDVTIFAPPASERGMSIPGVRVVLLPDHFGVAARGVMAERLDAGPARILVQYVPHAFGLRGANLPLCSWLRGRASRGDDVRVMFHEPYFYLSVNPAHVALAMAQRAMAALLLRSSACVYVSTDAWLPYLRLYAPRRFSAVTLPIPSTIPVVDETASVQTVRQRLSTGETSRLVGHFGTYGDHIAPLLADAFIRLLEADTSLGALCIGAGSTEFVRSLERRAPRIAGRAHAAGRLSASDVSIHLQCCDVVVQPYPDGVTTRRTSVMAGLANGRPIVTTDGELTEAVWAETSCAVLTPAGDSISLVDAVRELLRNDARRAALAERARAVYAERFALERTVATLRTASNGSR